MTIREILIYPNPKLRETAEPVTEFDDELKQLVEDMSETMYAFSGIGLAATQIGVSKRVFVMDVNDEEGLRVFINPKITARAPTAQLVEEGCLSFPGYTEKVSRTLWVHGTAQDVEGNEFQFALVGLAAQCAEHENEHLDGHVLVDNISRMKRRFITKDLQKRKKKKNLRYAIPNQR